MSSILTEVFAGRTVIVFESSLEKTFSVSILTNVIWYDPASKSRLMLEFVVVKLYMSPLSKSMTATRISVKLSTLYLIVTLS